MPINIIPENCVGCGEETTVYVRAASCGQSDVFILSSCCLKCEERKASEKRAASEQRTSETVGKREDESGDLVLPSESVKHHVYELIDDRDNLVFYVGITSNPNSRYSNHRNDTSGAAYPRFQEANGQCSMRVVATFDDRTRAQSFEALLINQTPGLLNRAIPGLRAV